MKSNIHQIKHKRGNPPLVLVILIDLLLVCLGLVIFALFHHVLPRDIKTSGESLPRPTTVQTSSAHPTAVPTGTAASETTEQTTSADPGDWGAKFSEYFVGGDPIITDTSYASRDLSVSIEKVQQDQVTYYIADIYIRNIENFRTAFAGGSYARGVSADVADMAAENNAILAITGDYYGIRDLGIVIRNGELYREKVFEDVLVMNYDGSMATFTADQFNMAQVRQNGAWQAWSFGPMLLNDGEAMTSFNSKVNPRNPRTAIGYYEPGHYCFVVVDGRQDGYSIGLTNSQMSQLFYDLGCSAAYNLDGGQSAVMAFMGEVISQPYKGGRQVSDIVLIGEQED